MIPSGVFSIHRKNKRKHSSEVEKPKPCWQDEKEVRLMWEKVRASMKLKPSLQTKETTAREFIKNEMNSCFNFVGSNSKPDSSPNIVPVKGTQFAMLHPKGRLKRYWDAIMGVAVVYSVLLIPVQIGFGIRTSYGTAWFVTDWIVFVVFFLDIIIAFQTAFFDDEKKEYVSDYTEVARHYFATWFVLDVLAALPYKFVEGSSRKGMITEALCWLRLLRMLKLYRMLTLVTGAETRSLLNPTMMGVIRMFVQLSCLCHIIACVWHWCAFVHPDDESTWLNVQGFPVDQTSIIKRYVVSLYFTTTTICTVGYGDISAYNTTERVLVIFFLFLGASNFGYIIGCMRELMEEYDETAAGILGEKVDEIRKYMTKKNIPTSLKRKLLKHFKYYFFHKYPTGVNALSQKVVDGLAPVIICLLVFSEHWPVIKDVPFLMDQPALFVCGLMQAFCPFYAKISEIIFREGDLASHIFVVYYGEINYFLANKKDTEDQFDNNPSHFPKHLLVERLCNTYFGQVPLLLGGQQRTDAVASQRSSLFTVHKSILLSLLKLYPNIQKEMLTEAKAFEKKVAAMSRSCFDMADSSEENVAAEHALKETSEAADEGRGWMYGAADFVHVPLESDKNTENVELEEVLGIPGLQYLPTVQRQVEFDTAFLCMDLPRSEQKVETKVEPIAASLNPEAGSHVYGIADNSFREVPSTKATSHKQAVASPCEHKPVNISTKMRTALNSKPACCAFLHDLIRRCLNLQQQLHTYYNSLENEVQTTAPEKLFLKTWLLHPESFFKSMWDILVAVMILYSVVMIIYTLAFQVDSHGAWKTIDVWLDAMFMTDIVVNFRTAMVIKEYLVINPLKIAFMYSRTWLLVDVVSSVPLELIHWNRRMSNPLHSVKILRLIRMLKVMRLLKLSKIFHKIEESPYFSHNGLRLVKLLSLMLFSTHVYACMFYAVAINAHPLHSTWLTNSCVSPANGGKICVIMLDTSQRYFAAAYWAATTMTSVGYGDIVPCHENILEVLVAILVQLTSAFVFAYVVGGFVDTVINSSPEDALIRKGLITITNHLSELDLSPNQVKTVLVQYTQLFHRSSGALNEEHDFLGLLPPNLRIQAVQSMYAAHTANLPLFSSIDTKFRGFSSIILPRLRLRIYHPKEIILQPILQAREMFFVVKGECSAEVDGVNHISLKLYKPGDFFAELAVLAGQELKIKLSFTVTAATTCHIFVLPKRDVDELIVRYPDIMERFVDELMCLLKIHDEEYDKLLRSAHDQSKEALFDEEAQRAIFDEETQSPNL